MDLVDQVGWNTLLFASKWFFIGLVYFALFVMVIAVRRELSYRIQSRQLPAVSSAGRLKVLDPGTDPGLRAGAVVELLPETTLGASQDCDIVLSDPFVSGRHVQISWDGVSWWIEDLGSRNGTSIDRQPCPPHSSLVFPPGSTLQVGEIIFQLLA